ncbi:hypothetical protein QM012_005572 [Aureobasidium pullulans]|uniref:S-adenosyl-L-methionine-dependent methyltransferase n=1 Tax=Aureobasidium pullulans TaxID=5580 RepID=A0ABR0T4T8_AURPU
MAESTQKQASSDAYGLTRDAAESARLNAQHNVWKTNIGYLFHPRIQSDLAENACIADIGTGTGVWIEDLATEMSVNGRAARYEGLDISSSQFPQSSQNGVVFSTFNLLEPAPKHMHATFDVIHLRLLILGLPRNTWKSACENILSLLKPGGWVQWEEADFARTKVVQNMPGVSINAARQLQEQITQDGRDHGQGWDDVRDLASTMSSAGFGDVSVDVFSSDRVASTRDGFNKSVLGAVAGIMKMFVKADGESSFWNSEPGLQMHADATSELANDKAYYRTEINVVYARKTT